MSADLARQVRVRELVEGGQTPANVALQEPVTTMAASVPQPTTGTTVAWPGGRQVVPRPAGAPDPVARPLRAVALRYDPFSGPPRVVATGRGHVAEALLARAREAGVPIEAHPDLVEVLMALRIDQVIPPALYVAVAQVLAWAYVVDERVGRLRPPTEPPRR